MLVSARGAGDTNAWLRMQSTTTSSGVRSPLTFQTPTKLSAGGSISKPRIGGGSQTRLRGWAKQIFHSSGQNTIWRFESCHPNHGVGRGSRVTVRSAFALLWAKPYALGQAPSIAAICLRQL
jgi:hypothetical protein